MNREMLGAILGAMALITGVVAFSAIMMAPSDAPLQPEAGIETTVTTSTTVADRGDGVPASVERVLLSSGAAVDYQSSELPGVPAVVARVLSESGAVLMVTDLPEIRR